MRAIEQALKCEFTLIVTPWESQCNSGPAGYRCISISQFLHLQSLSDEHVLFCVPQEHQALVFEHYLRIRQAARLSMAHFLVKDYESVDGLSVPEERFAFPDKSVIWQYIVHRAIL